MAQSDDNCTVCGKERPADDTVTTTYVEPTTAMEYSGRYHYECGIAALKEFDRYLDFWKHPHEQAALQAEKASLEEGLKNYLVDKAVDGK